LAATPHAEDDGHTMFATAWNVGTWTTATARRPVVAVLGSCRRTGEQAVVYAVDSALTSRQAALLVEGIADRLLQQGLAERFIERLLEAPEVERLVGVALDSPGMQRLVTRVVESHLTEATMGRLLDDALARLPQTQALWALIDEVAQSPAVTDAITQQGLGLADEVATDLRDRSRDADAWLERAARRLLRRHAEGGGPAGGMPAPQLP
jgi:hypothetical protein